MQFIRIYSLSATAGQEAALETALDSLRQVVTAVDGCEGFTIARDRGTASAYTVLEFWQSSEHHEASAAIIPKSCFRAIMDTLSQPPAMKDLVKTG